MEDKEIKRKYCVYVHTSPSNKKYVGITSKKPKERWKNGKGYSHNRHFTNAINKYGWDNFKHEIIKDGLDELEAQKLEKELIRKYDTFDSNHGYNCTSGGEIGKQHTEEVRKKQSELAKMLWQNDEYRKNQIAFKKTLIGEKNPNYGNHKLAGKNNPMYGKKLSPEVIEKMKNRVVSDEARMKMSIAAKNRMTPEFIERLRIANTGRHPSDESRKKMSESQKSRWNDEMRKEWSKKFSGENNGMFGKHHSEETKQLLREKFSGENSVWFGKHHTDETKQKLRDAMYWKVPIVQLSLNGEYVAEYDSCASASKAINKSPSSIIECCNEKYKSAYGYLWIRKDKYDKNKKYSYTNEIYKRTVKLTKEWEYISTYDSVAEASRSENAIKQNVGRSCKLKGNAICCGFRWMYEKDYIEMINEKEN